MKKLFACIGVVALAATVMASAASAADVNFWFANQGTTTAISQVNTTAGSVFYLDLLMTTGQICTGFDIAVAYGDGLKVNMVDDGSGSDPAVFVPDVTVPTGTGKIGTLFPSQLALGETAFGNSGKSGLEIAYTKTSGSQAAFSTAKLVGTIGFVATKSDVLSFYDAGSGDAQTSFITNADTGAFYRPGQLANVNVVVPEPSALLALGSGLMGLAGFAVRRRRA